MASAHRDADCCSLSPFDPTHPPTHPQTRFLLRSLLPGNQGWSKTSELRTALTSLVLKDLGITKFRELETTRCNKGNMLELLRRLHTLGGFQTKEVPGWACGAHSVREAHATPSPRPRMAPLQVSPDAIVKRVEEALGVGAAVRPHCATRPCKLARVRA